MSDEETVRWYLDKRDDRAGWEALDRLVAERNALLEAQQQTDERLEKVEAERDSLRAALERIVRTPLDINDEGDAEALQAIARQALTSSEKEKAEQ